MSTSPPETARPDLQGQIALVEQRLIARQQGLKQKIDDVNAAARQALRPQRLLMPLLGAGFVGAAAWWALRGRKHSAPRASAAPPAGSFAGLPFGDVFGLVWPLLPPHWRSRFNPSAVATWISLGLPMVERLLGRKPGAPAPAVAPSVDLERFSGTWYELARLPAPFEGACASQPTTTYTERGDGQIDVLNQCLARSGTAKDAHGIARVVPGSNNAKLQLSLLPQWLRWLPFAWGDYWVLHVDDDYQVAVVGNPARNFLWLLAREPSVPADLLDALVELARAQGYSVDKLRIAAPA